MTKVFTQDTAPSGFSKEHTTPKGVWALLHVRSGSLKFRVTDQAAETTCDVTPEAPKVIVEAQPHHIMIDGPVSFQVEFFNQPK